MPHKRDDVILKIIIAVIAALLMFSVFKNIAYPLLWNDEAETAMFAKRVMEFGYPKVHDGKNVLNLLQLPDKEMGIDKKSDAYVVTVWGHFYFAAIGEAFARLSDDIYLKTALLRIPFATAGLLGLAIIAMSCIPLFRTDKKRGLIFLTAFLLLELFSVPLILHMREVRYYSLAVFLMSSAFYLYSRYSVLRTLRASFYIPLLAINLLLLYNTFPPPFFACAIMIALTEFLKLLKRKSIRGFVLGASPVFIAGLFIIPILNFYNTAAISNAFAAYFEIKKGFRKDILLSIFSFFWRYELLCAIVFTRTISIVMQYVIKVEVARPGQGAQKKNRTEGIANDVWEEIVCRRNIAHFLSIFFLIYIMIVSQVPLPYIFERYYIVLQPFLSVVLLFDIFNISSLISNMRVTALKKRLEVIPLAIALLIMVSALSKIELVRDHAYELFHQYKGPLDYAIPYIQSNYTDTANLVIATNYEECSLMYYLGSKVTIGYVGNNIEEDMKFTPDIILFRKRHAYTNKSTIFGALFTMARYQEVVFPVFDTPVNNIPQVSGPLPHFFKTKMAEGKDTALVLNRKL